MRGAAREEQARAAVRDAEVSERAASSLHPLLEVSCFGAWHPVPRWSYRPLGVGEWREREGEEVVRRVRARRAPLRGESRRRRLAEASGTFEWLSGARPGSMRCTQEPRKRQRLSDEDGADQSGVT